MDHWKGWAVLVGIVVMLCVAPASAAEEEEGPNRGRVSFSLGSDITNAYFFRGILNERDGFIWQPYADLGFNLYKGDGAVSSVDLGFGIWFSFQTEKTLASGDGPSNLYEVDYFPSISVSFANGLSTSLAYTLYTGPILIAGSTHEGEEETLLGVYRKLVADHPELRLVIAPRYIDRATRVMEQVQAQGFSVSLRSQGNPNGARVVFNTRWDGVKPPAVVQ